MLDTRTVYVTPVRPGSDSYMLEGLENPEGPLDRVQLLRRAEHYCELGYNLNCDGVTSGLKEVLGQMGRRKHREL